ncbi:hypothetical protein Scep_004856 [Stephania cephalantha]|uniref:Transposase MuDR plant domain-containing protein n=1 Tax=Stephania cephalantha TaxID=152367 RepID=A0AAP0KUY6_9MAGN
MDLEVSQQEEVEPPEEQDNGTIQHEEVESDKGHDFFESDNDVEDDDDYQEVVDEQLHNRKKGRPKVITSPRSSALAIVEVHDQDSDYAASDELHTDDDSDGSEKMSYVEFDEFKDMANPQLELGMKFSSFKAFKLACRNWGIQNRRQIRFTTNDMKRCICKCQRFKSSNCEFRIFASHVGKDDSTVQIKSINLTHSCTKVNKNYHVTSIGLHEKSILNNFEWTQIGQYRVLYKE